MSLINDIQIFANIILVLIIVFGLIAMLATVYFTKIHKPKKEEEDDQRYANYPKTDVRYYVPIKDIKDKMIIMKNNLTMVGSVVTRGFDFFYSHPKEQYDTNRGYIGFISSIDEPIQLRISSKQLDLENRIKKYEKNKTNLEFQLMNLYNEGIVLENNYEKMDDKTQKAYAERMQVLDKKIINVEWQISHVDQIASYLKEISEEKSSHIRESRYIFSHTCSLSDFPEGTSMAEIYKRADKELETKVAQMKHPLSSCGVKVTRADYKSLRESIRGHLQPYGKSIFKSSDLDNSNYNEMIVTSTSLKEAKVKYQKYMKQIEEQNRILSNIEKRKEY